MANVVGGRLFLTIDGQQFSPRGAFTLRPTTLEREADSNHDGSLFVTAKPVPAELEGSLSYTDNIDINALSELDGVSVTVELENGDTYVYADATVVGRIELNTETGEISNFMIASDSVTKVS
jgi:hypothetical protein